ncbi:MAG: carbohydrate ABC transporter permease [Anaerolineae bacterium]|nr:carbohydrate ABC transporter permease [Anaerolineae bacterium]
MTTSVSAASAPSTAHSRGENRLGRIAFYIVCTALAALFLFPIVWTAISSVKPPPEASAVPPTFLPSRLDLGNFVKLNEYGRGVWNYVGNSAGTAVMTVIGATLLSTLAGYGFSRFQFRGKGLLFVMILMTLMIPFQSILIPLFLILTGLKLQNTLFGLALVYITFQLPFGVFIMRNSFDAVPREIEEAALLDGCSSLSMLYRVMLNIVRPGIITVGIYAFLNSWNEFLAALIFMTKETSFTLPILLTSVRSGYYGSIDWGALQAGLIVTIAPCILIFLLLQRYYISGLTGGATKG